MPNLFQPNSLSLVSLHNPVLGAYASAMDQLPSFETDRGLIQAEDVYEPVLVRAATGTLEPQSRGVLPYFAQTDDESVRPEASANETNSDLAVTPEDSQAVVAEKRLMAAELIVAALLVLTGKNVDDEERQTYIDNLVALFGKLSAEEFMTEKGQIIQIAKALLAFTKGTLPKELVVQFAQAISQLLQASVPLAVAKEAIVKMVQDLRGKVTESEASTYEEIINSVTDTKIIEVKSKTPPINLAPNISIAIERNPNGDNCDVLVTLMINETTDKAVQAVLEGAVAVLFQDNVLNGIFRPLREGGFPILMGAKIFFDMGHIRTPEGKTAEEGDQVAVDIVHDGTLFRFLLPFTPRHRVGYVK